MRDTLEGVARSVADLSRNVSDQAKSISELVSDQRELKDEVENLLRDKAVNEVEDKHLEERLKEIEARINSINSLGRWLLGAIGLAVITTVMDFILHGGLTHVG